jgi:uncharacterized protein (TIGR00266 family)
MQFSIDHSPVFTTLKIDMQQGESFKAEAGAMVSKSPTIEIKATGSGKGLLGSLKAAVGGEALFASIYTAERGPGELVLAPTLPGDIIRFDLQGTILAQGGAYLAGSPELDISTKGSFKAMFAGEGLFLSKISGNGILFLNSYGAIYDRELAPGEKYVVDTGHIVAFQESVNYSLHKAAKGIFSTLASGEGLVCEYTGPGKIWIQTRNLSALGAIMAKFVTKS